MFKNRSNELERIDTGDYTSGEYEDFLRIIGSINRWMGDFRAMRRTLWREIERKHLPEFSVLDIGAGSGAMLVEIAKMARRQKINARLYGLELNEPSARMIGALKTNFPEIISVRGDALKLPFADGAFDYTICSLFTHHLTDEKIIAALREMRRVTRREIFVSDLHRHPLAYAGYQMLGKIFIRSQLVREDGSLSILRGFKPRELAALAAAAGLSNFSVRRSFPFRLVLQA